MAGFNISEVNREKGRVNRERIRAYFLEHIGASNVECGRALGLNPVVVGRHIRAIRRERDNNA